MIGSQFGRSERAEMVQVSVQHASQGRPLANDSRPGMMPPMDSPLVAFGLAKPSFQVQIVSRQFIDRAQKQTRQKTCHQSHQVLGDHHLFIGRVLACTESPVPPLLFQAGHYRLLGEVL